MTSASFWILTKYFELETNLESNLLSYELGHNINLIYKFLWDYYADWYIEFLKTQDLKELEFGKQLFQQFVITISPYCPFETEALWSQFFGQKAILASHLKDSQWSTKAFNLYFEQYDLSNLYHDSRYREFDSIVSFVSELRSLRGLFGIDPQLAVEVLSKSPVLFKYQKFISQLAKAKISITENKSLYEVKNNHFAYHIDILKYITDLEHEKKRTNKIILDLDKQIKALEKQLSNQQFVQNAELEIIEEKKQNLKNRNLEILQQQSKLDFFASRT